MKANTSFGEFIRSMRQKRGEPLRVIASEADIDSTLLSKLERGERFPTADQIAKFAKLFRVPEQELKGRVIADKVVSEYDDDTVTRHAVQFLKERVTPYRTNSK